MDRLDVKVNLVLKEILEMKESVIIKVNRKRLDQKVKLILVNLELKESVVLQAQTLILEEVESMTCVDGYRT